MKLLLHQYIFSAKLFSLDFLNKKVSSFNLGNDSKNKPSHISKNHLKQGGELKQSGEYNESLICIADNLGEH